MPAWYGYCEPIERNLWIVSHFINKEFSIQRFQFTRPAPSRWNPPWLGEGTDLAKRFRPVSEQGQLVGATQLHSIRTNRSLCLRQGPDSKWKELDQISLLIFSIFTSLAGLLSGRLINIYDLFMCSQYIISLSWSGVLSLEVKYDILRNGDEGTW